MILSLAAAIREDLLQEFIAQEEARGVGPALKADLDSALARLIKPEKSEDQTSRSASFDGSTGRRTR